METAYPQNLKYGIIYLYSDRRFSPGLHDPESIVEKFVYPLQVEWIDEPGRDDILMIARRFNVGNIGNYATVSLTLSRMNRSGGWFEAIRRFADELMGVTDAGDGDIVLNEADFGINYFEQPSVFEGVSGVAPQDKTRVEHSKLGRWRKFGKKLREMQAGEDDDREISVASCPDAISYHSEEVAPQQDLLQEEEDLEIQRLERKRKEALEHIRHEIVSYIAQFHDDPKQLIGELLRGKVIVGQPGRLLVNGDMDIVLPEYDEMVIEMPAMCRTLYILFMKVRKQGGEGIVLKNIDEYSDEIVNIYTLVKPGANGNRVAQSVANLCDPFGESLNQTISRINRCIRNVIPDKELAQSYLITGTRGEPYGIGLAADYLELPRAVTGA